MKFLAHLLVPVSLLVACSGGAYAGDFVSHSPQRPLPTASERALLGGDIHVVDAMKGNDTGAGTAEQPWRTLGHAASQLTQGGVICLRSGVHRMHATVSATGTEQKALVIRSWPGELAVLDGGFA